jgi:hypothetical protein
MEFGYPVERFTPGRAVARFVRLAGALDVLLGVGMAIWARLTEQHIGVLIAGIALIASGVAVLVVARFIGKGGVLVCPRGLVFAKSGSVDSAKWEDLREIRLLADSGAERVLIVRKSGEERTLTPIDVGDFDRFVDVLRKESSRRKVAWS